MFYIRLTFVISILVLASFRSIEQSEISSNISAVVGLSTEQNECTSSTLSKVGDIIDSLHGIPVYYNGKFTHVNGRNVTPDGYNLGLKWQCVEFVKRYYYERFGHKMPDSYGHAKDFFDSSIGDVGFNMARGLMQYKNVRYEKPQIDDILVYDSFSKNPYGHVGIIAEINQDHIILVQQNMGKKTRQKIKLIEYNGIYTVADFDVLGWLRL